MVIDDLYQRLVVVDRLDNGFVSAAHGAKEQGYQRQAEEAINELWLLIEKNRIYLPTHVCTELARGNDQVLPLDTSDL